MFFDALEQIRVLGLLGRCTSLKADGIEASFAEASGQPSADDRVAELERRLEEERKIKQAGVMDELEEELKYGSS